MTLQSYRVFFQQLLWVASFRQAVLCCFKHLLQLSLWLIKPLHEAAVGLHTLPPLCRFPEHDLKKHTGCLKNVLTLISCSIKEPEAWRFTCEADWRSATLFCRRFISMCWRVLLLFIIFWMVWWFLSITVRHFLQLCVKVASSCSIQCQAGCQLVFIHLYLPLNKHSNCS